MGWAAIITALLQIFGPILGEWLKKWLDSLLNKAAARLPDAETFGSPDAARAALFDEAIASLPRFAFARRSLLRRMRAHGTGELTPDQKAEFCDLAGAAENE